MKKKRKIFFFSVLTLIIVLVTVVFFFYYTGRISVSGKIRARVSSDAVIERDARGFPRIIAQTERDFYYALGYLHGADRLPLMEYLRLCADGKSGNAGEDTSVFDSIAVKVGFSRQAVQTLEKMDKKYADFLAAYTEGLNNVRDRLRLGKQGGAWKPVHIVALFHMLEWSAAFLSNMELFFPMSENDRAKGIWKIVPEYLRYYYNSENSEEVLYLLKLRGEIEKAVGFYNRGFAFYLYSKKDSEKLSGTGFGFHSQLAPYPAVYPLAAEIGGEQFACVTYAGLPFIFSGRKDTLSFFNYQMAADSQLFFIEKVREGGKGLQYLSRRGWKNFIPKRNPYLTKSGVTVKEVIWETDNGPVINESFNNVESRDSVITIKSVFPGHTYIETLFRLPFVKNSRKGAALVSYSDSMPHVYLFAEKDRAVSVISGETVRKIRSNVLHRGTGVYPGKRRISRAFVRRRGPVVVSSTYPGYDNSFVRSFSFVDSLRFNRARELLEEINGSFDIEKITGVLTDTYSEMASEYSPVFFALLKANPVTSARLTRLYFHDWDYNMDKGSVAATIFSVLYREFIKETIADELGDMADKFLDRSYLLSGGMLRIAKIGKNRLFNNINTEASENREAVFDRAFLNAMRILGRKLGPVMDKWKWSESEKGYFQIPFFKNSVLNSLLLRIPESGFSGSEFSLSYIRPGIKLKPREIISLYGYWNTVSSFARIRFGQALSPYSGYFYGTAGEMGDITFDVYKPVNTLVLTSK